MGLKLMKAEVIKEMEASRRFIELAILAQKAGYTKAASFFMGEAREDCGHAFLYALELDKYNEVEGNASITEIVKEFEDLEANAVERVKDLGREAKQEGKESIWHFVNHMAQDHLDAAYKARKLLQKINMLGEDSINDIEDLFQEMSDDED